MTINLTELRDEPLGEHLSNYVSFTNPTSCMCGVSQPETDVDADSGAESVFKFDFKSLSDEALGIYPCRPMDRFAGFQCHNPVYPCRATADGLETQEHGA